MLSSKLSLVALATALAFTGASAYADTLNLGTSVGSFTFKINGQTETAGGGNFVGSSAVIGGKTVDFSAVYCVDLFDSISNGHSYNATFNPNGVVNGSAVNNAAEIAWLILNTTVTTTEQSEGLQAAIWEVEYGTHFSLVTGGLVASAETADLAALGNKTGSIGALEWISSTQGSGRDQDQLQGLVGLPNDPPPPVPEPATLSLFGTGILGLAALVRRRLTA